ncbi:MAG TPA: uroporphyrinogen decarboxylase [Caulobacteraceae bacterium]|jgi:uroporphyrinogen decarboxylase|nr:uroporphyrinogen decarboxylase [Caulobacteraceae bacterium]
MVSLPEPRLLTALKGDVLERPPIWFMRQAGRCLPEYRELRARAGDFLELCFDPEIATEITLQPMRRFAYDAAIVFSDIVPIALALGQKVWFEAGEGPRMGALPAIDALAAEVEASTGRLAAIGETVRRARAGLEPERALIGFAGGPWTVATYMLQGRGGEAARAEARARAFTDLEAVGELVDVVAEATWRYLVMQVEAGAQAVQIFESWAEQLPEPVFERLVTRPHARIVAGLRAAGVTAPVIGFPRGADEALIEPYVAATGVQAVGLGTGVSRELGRRLQKTTTIQGALDPQLLLAGGPALDAAVDALLADWGAGPWIFNLGHGVLPPTPVEHISRVVERVTAWRGS